MTPTPAPRAKDVVAWAVVDPLGEMDGDFIASTEEGAVELCPDPTWRIARVRITEIQQEATRDAG